MTGIELLKQEMLAKGCTKAQCESKAVGVILDIVANAGGKYSNEQQMLKDIQELESRRYAMQRALDMIKYEKQRIMTELNREREELQSYTDRFYKALDQCDTPEQRDVMRTAQMFVNSVTVDTKYDNTAYIIGLAAILSGGNIGPMDELRKINKKIPAPRLWNGFNHEIIDTEAANTLCI